MSLLRRLINLTRRDRIAREIDREMAFHIAERADALREAGLSEDEATYEARRRFGNAGLQRERARDADLLPWLEAIGQDARYAIRTLRAHPAFSIVVTLSLALGIGANVAVFSIVDALLLRNLPVHRPQELVQVVRNDDRSEVSNPVWEQLRDGPSPFSAALATGNASFQPPGGGERRWIRGQWVSGSFFATLGVAPAEGRLLTVNDDVKGCPAVAVISHAYFQSRFAANPSTIGKRIALGEDAYQIVGVAPASFHGIDVGFPPQVYLPLCRSTGLANARNNFLHVVGRLRDDKPFAAAAAMLDARSAAIYSSTLAPETSGKRRDEYLATRLTIVPAPRGLTWLGDQFKKPLLILMGVAGLVLIVTCANIANLLLARATARERELSIRLAIGAGRGRLLRQLLTESIILSLIGAAVGVVAAIWGSRALFALMAANMPGAALDLGVDARLLGFGVAIAFATGLVFGMAPAWRVMGLDLVLPLGRGVSRAIRVRSHQLVPRALVVVQLAVSMILIFGALLFVETFRKLVSTDPGFDARSILIAGVSLNKGVDTVGTRAAIEELQRQLESTPGVTAVTTTSITPLSGSSMTYAIRVEGTLRTEGVPTYIHRVGPTYFPTMRATIAAGRPFKASDAAGSPLVAVVTQEAALTLFGDRAPIGRRFRMSGSPDAPLYEVVGVAGDSKFLSLREKPLPMIYLSDAQSEAYEHQVFLIRYESTEREMRERVTNLLQRTMPAAVVGYDTMQHQVDATLVTERMLAYLSGFFGVIGFIVAIIGLYGLMSYVVTTRQKELGIRMALGAQRGQVLRGVLAEASVLTAAGAVAGMVVALLASRFVASMLFGVSARDEQTVIIAAAILLVVAGVASLVPAWRASRLDPLVALRE